MSHPEEEELSSPTDVSTHVPASPREGDTFFYHLSGLGLKPTAKPQEGGFRSHEIFDQLCNCLVLCCLLRCSLWGPPLRFLSHTTPDSEPQEDTTCSRFCNTFLARRHRTHISLCSGRLGVGPTPSGGRSHGQGMLRKIHSGGFRAYPMKAQCFPAGHTTQAELRSSLPQEAGLGTALQGTENYHLHTASFQGQLKVGISALTLQIKPGTSQTASRSQDTATEPPGAFRAQAPGALHKTLDKQQHKQDQKLLTHHKAAEELTPAFSFSSVCISVKYIIYSSIGLIVIYYSLELLLSFPYFNHIYASNFAYRSYCLEFIIEIHRIKLK